VSIRSHSAVVGIPVFHGDPRTLSGQHSLRVERATAADDNAWDAYVMSRPAGTFFHLSGWRRALERTYGLETFSCVARRDGEIVGILPLCLVRTLPLGRSLVSIPFAVYGGVCADDAEGAGALLAYAKRLADERGVRYLELRHRQASGGLAVKERYVTFGRAIHRDPEKNLSEIPRKQRRMVRQGEKHGLTAAMGGEELLSEFYAIYAESVRNLGTPVFPRTWFVNLFGELGPACRILGVFHEKRMLSGVLTFFFRDQVMPYYGGATRDAFRYAVNDFMYWQLICYGAERGYGFFDFGRSKVGSGSYDFKRHWGFEPKPLPYEYYLVRQREMPDLSPMNPRFALAVNVWKRLPLGMANWLGPHLARYFP
jgi:FemAB-related protein (PEP-CTERM system-associated)